MLDKPGFESAEKLKPEKERADYEEPEYSTLFGSLRHVFISSLGDMELDSYKNSEMSWVLGFLFILLSFLMCIHLLNMLIAIMGQSFDRNNEVADSNKKIS